MSLDPTLRSLLVCPVCRGELTDVPDALWCRACDRVYVIVDGIPHLVPELSRAPTDAERAFAR